MLDQTKNYKVKTPDGRVWDIPEKSLDAAIGRGAQVIDNNAVEQPSEAPSQFKKVTMPDGRIWEVPQDKVRAAVERGGKLEDDVEDTTGRILARSAKSLTAGAWGSIPDTITSAYNIPAALENAKTPEMRSQSQAIADQNPYGIDQDLGDTQLPLIPSVTEAVDKGIDEATGGYTKTKEGDSLQTGLKMVGAVASPGALANVASKAGMKATSTALHGIGTTKPAGLVGAGAAGVATEEATKAGYGTPAAIAAGVVAGAGTGIVTQALRSFDTKVALAKLTGNSPKNINLEAVKAAEESGLGYNNTLVNESGGLALVDQLISKTPYFGTKRAKKLNAQDQQFAEAVDNSIKKVGEKIIESDSALDTGSMLKDTFSDLKQNVIGKKNELYEQSRALLPNDADTRPKHLMDTIDDIRGKIKTLRPSPDQAFVLKYLDDLESGILLGSKENKMLLPVPVDMLQGSKVSINDIINWDVNASGAKEHLKKIQYAIGQDLEAYGKTNKEWYTKFKEADTYYGKYLGDEALGSDTVKKKIFAQNDPEKIIPSLKNISDFKTLEQSLGADATGQAFFNSIKREKLSDLLMGQTIDPKTGNISYIGFAKAVENPANKELVKYLAGDTYNEIQNFSKYAAAAIKRNQRIPNPSGTATTKTVISTLGAAVTAGVVGGVAAGVTAGVAPLATTAATGMALNWFVTNKSALKWGIEAAKKQSQGDMKAANILSGRIERAMVNDLGDDFVRQFISLSNKEDHKKEP